MTVERILLSAHQCERVCVKLALDALDPGLESTGPPAGTIIYQPVRTIDFAVFRTATELFAQKNVAHASFTQPKLYFRLAEMREAGAQGAAANVAHKGDFKLS